MLYLHGDLARARSAHWHRGKDDLHEIFVLGRYSYSVITDQRD